jgi:hypothetical protein
MPAPIKDVEALRRWQKSARGKLSELLGLNMMEFCPLLPKLINSEQKDGYRMDHILIQSQPDIFIPIFVLIPENIDKGAKRPAFLSQLGHGPGKFFLLDLIEYKGMSRWKEKFYNGKKNISDFFISMVKEGYLVFLSDAIGAGERREYMEQGEENFGECSHIPINNLAISMGFSVIGIQVWDLMRTVDYIFSREDSDGRISVGGLSGGGHQSLFFAALDERIQAIITSGWFYGFKESHFLQPDNCNCNFVPGLWNYFDCCDIGSMVAPKALHIETGEYDQLNGKIVGLGNVVKQVEITRKSYDLYQKKENLVHYIHSGGHEWDGGKAIEFIHDYMPLIL